LKYFDRKISIILQVEEQMNLKRVYYFSKVICLIAIISLSACDQPNDPTPPETTIISLILQSDNTETVDATHPIRWEISTTYNFTDIVETGTVTTIDSTTIDVELDAGSYFVRAYIDADNNGLLSYGDTLSIHSLMGSTQLIYSPKKVILVEGQTESVTLRPGVDELTENDSAIPENFGTIYIHLNYTGSGTVDSDHWLYVGVSTDPTLVAVFMGFSVQQNGAKVYAIVPAGTWYVGGFFDIDGNAVMPDGMPDSGDPTKFYNNSKIYDGSNEADPITVVAGTQTEMIDLVIDGTILFP